MRDFSRKGAGIRDQDPPFYQTLLLHTSRILEVSAFLRSEVFVFLFVCLFVFFHYLGNVALIFNIGDHGRAVLVLFGLFEADSKGRPM